MKKKIVFMFALLFSSMGMMAQRMVETVYLKNGSIIRGTIIEQVPGQSLKIQTKDGNVFVYQMSEVERIAKEQASTASTSISSNGNGHRGLDVTIEGGVALGKGGSANGIGGIELGKRFSPNFYWGIGTGVTGGGKSDVFIPITTTFKALFPIAASRGIAPNIAFRTGFRANTAEDKTIGSGKNKTTIYKAEHGWDIAFLPGIQVPLGQKVDFNFNLGYQCGISFGGGAGHAFVMNAGFGFHKPYEKNKQKTEKGPEPLYDNGVQLTWDLLQLGFIGAKGARAGSAPVLSYKWNPHVSVGIGYGYSYIAFDTDNFSDNGSAHSLFLRGQYRLTDKKCSPFASVDIGFRKYNWDDDNFTYSYYYTIDEIRRNSGFLFTPAVGLSVRGRKRENLYTEIKLGYNCTSPYKLDTDPVEKSNVGDLFFSVGITRTFKWGAKVKGKMTDQYTKTKSKISKK